MCPTIELSQSMLSVSQLLSSICHHFFQAVLQLATMTSKSDHKKAGSEAQNNADEKARREELVEAKIRAVRKKNEELMKRQLEIEEDRRNANKYSEMAVKKHHEHAASGVAKESPVAGSGRGRGRGLMLQEMRKETLKAKQWEAKRRENIKREEEERNRTSKTTGSSRFLVDDDRVDMSRTTGRNEHSWGGTNFNKVVNRVQREKEGFRSGRSKGNIEMTMSGKERQQYYQWREERMKIDEERKTRQKKAGNWSRAWDQKKTWDSRKKMWVYEDDDDYNDARRRKESDSSEDWGNDSRNSRQVDRGRGKGERGSRQAFIRHDDRKMEASEEWGETSEEGVSHNNESGSKNETDTKFNHQHGAVSGLGVGEDWEEEMPVTSDNKVESSTISTESDHVESNTPEPPKELEQTRERNDPEANDQHNNSRDSHKEPEPVTAETSDLSQRDAPKPQRQVKQRRNVHTSDVNEQLEIRDSHKEQESALEEMPPSDKNSLHEPLTSNKESLVTDKDQEHLHMESQVVSDGPESGDGDGESNNRVSCTMGNDRADTEPETTVDEQQATTNISNSIEEVNRTNESEDAHRNSSRAQKANLPKLVTKVDKKVTFDTSEKNDPKEESESKDTAVSLEIPPTPDFLKVDKGVDWGDFEIDEEELVERW